MIDNHQFISATDFLKTIKKISYKKIAEQIGINQGRIDNLRRNGVPMDLKEAQDLVRVFPEVLKFFTESFKENEAMKYTNSDVVHDSMVMVTDGNAWREAYFSQKKLSEALEHRLLKVEEENRELVAENRVLLHRLLEKDKNSLI